MTKPNPSVKPVDRASLNGLPSHAETHWLTFATALKVYAQCPTRPALASAAQKHGPSWLRGALKGKPVTARRIARPPELDPKTGSLAFLTRGAQKALEEGQNEKMQATAPIEPSICSEQEHRKRLERYLTLAAARADVHRRIG